MNEKNNNNESNESETKVNKNDSPLLLISDSLSGAGNINTLGNSLDDNTNFTRTNAVNYLIDGAVIPVNTNTKVSISFGDISLFSRLFNVEVFGIDSIGESVTSNLTIGGVSVFSNNVFDITNLTKKVKEITGNSTGLTTAPIVLELSTESSNTFSSPKTVYIKLSVS